MDKFGIHCWGGTCVRRSGVAAIHAEYAQEMFFDFYPRRMGADRVERLCICHCRDCTGIFTSASLIL